MSEHCLRCKGPLTLKSPEPFCHVDCLQGFINDLDAAVEIEIDIAHTAIHENCGFECVEIGPCPVWQQAQQYVASLVDWDYA